MAIDPKLIKIQFKNSGAALTKRILGPTRTLSFVQNGVELQFSIDAQVLQKYKSLQPRQYSGPQCLYVKRGSLLGGTWTTVVNNQGEGWDNPDEENVINTGSQIAYYDAPGPNIHKYAFGLCRIHAVQNFTGWVVGKPKKGGEAERLSEVVSWYSIVSIALVEPEKKGDPFRVQRLYGCGSGLGWRDISLPPA